MIISLADYFLGCISLTPNRLNQQGKNIRYCVYFPTIHVTFNVFTTVIERRGYIYKKNIEGIFVRLKIDE